MAKALVITPVKNSIETTLETAAAIQASTVPVTHKIFNDFSSPETKALLDQNAPKIGYELVHLEEITDTPSPNYKLVLQMAQKEAVAMQLPLLVVESDVTVEKDTIKRERIAFMNSKHAAFFARELNGPLRFRRSWSKPYNTMLKWLGLF